MKKAIFLILIGSLFALSVNAQRYYNVTYMPQCVYSGSNGLQQGMWDPSQYAVNVNRDVCNVIGINYINIYRGSIDNACATTVDFPNDNYGRVPVVIYNRDFMGELHRHNEWAPISVVAHEIGHHFNGDLSQFGFNNAFSRYGRHLSDYQKVRDNWDRELEADYVSGWVLYKLGASLNDATVVWEWIIVQDGSYTHPNSSDRVEAVKLGWYAARGF